MEVINIGEKSSVLNSFVAQLRDKDLQKDSLRFRTNLNRLGQIFGYEISKTLASKERDVVTPLGTAHLSEPETALRLWKLAKQKGDDTCTPLLKKKIKRKKYIK